MTKEFKLYDRILFIIEEYQLISLLYYKTKIGEKIDWKENIIESAKLMRENYYCYSEEMMNLEIAASKGAVQLGENIIDGALSSSGNLVDVLYNCTYFIFKSFLSNKI